MPAAQVLIVHDGPSLLEPLAETLRLRLPDVTIESCHSASTALEPLLVTDYDAVISDVTMLRDGLALLKQAKRIRPSTPILMITASDDEALPRQLLEAGAYDFVQKPVDWEAFVQSIESAIELRRLRLQAKEIRRLERIWVVLVEALMARRLECPSGRSAAR